MGPRRLEGIGVEEISKTAKKYTRAKRELVSVLVHVQRALHTPCSAHDSNGTLIDKRNGQKRMLDTRIIHVLCLWWKMVFAAMVREAVPEGGDEHFSPNWRTKERRRNARTAMHGMALDFSWKIQLELAHRHVQRFLLHKERNDKRTNVQGRPLDGGVIGGAAHFLLDLRQNLQTMENEPSNTTAHDAVSTLGRDGGLEIELGSWSVFADELFIKDEILDHTAETAKDIILNNAPSLDEMLAEDRYKQKL